MTTIKLVAPYTGNHAGYSLPIALDDLCDGDYISFRDGSVYHTTKNDAMGVACKPAKAGEAVIATLDGFGVWVVKVDGEQ